MLSNVVLKEIKKIGICTAVLTAVMLIVFKIIGYFNSAAFFGALLGYLINFFNFVVMSITVEFALSKHKSKASSLMGLSYFVRLAVIAVAVCYAIKSPHINYVAAVIPLIFTRISVYILNFFGKRGDAA